MIPVAPWPGTRVAARLRSDVRSAVLYAKPTTVINPDFVWKATDKWIVFPWSAKPPVGQR
ncbi:xanthine-guanine phosphoribosyltransferase [Cutibacterium acnes JCM 18916]|nr:xanthine-guanine phosphoribosyltransferase [Cutibacterium acnes JCM 18916]